MRKFKTKFIKTVLNCDFFATNKTEFNILKLTEFTKSIKQLIKIIQQNKNLPIFLICQNKQHRILLKNYINKKRNKIFVVSSKTAVALNVNGIFILLHCENSFLLSQKIQQKSNSILFSIDGESSLSKYYEYYSLNTNMVYLKQILFIITLLNKITKSYEII